MSVLVMRYTESNTTGSSNGSCGCDIVVVVVVKVVIVGIAISDVDCLVTLKGLVFTLHLRVYVFGLVRLFWPCKAGPH